MGGVRGALILLFSIISFVAFGIGAVFVYGWMLLVLMPGLGDGAALFAVIATFATYMIVLYKAYPYSEQD